MRTSVAWLNQHLDRPASAEEQADLLTRAGFPVEHSEIVTLPDGSTDTRQEVELTSNRGDCLSHAALAGEVAAMSGRRVRPRPAVNLPTGGPPAASMLTVDNREPGKCPLYTARVIRGIKVAPSPPWLANRLLARGDIPRNNIVDASNYILFEFGQPTHVFDLAALRGPAIVVRHAHRDERFLPIGEGAAEVRLHPSDLVIADAERAVAIAGVKGGAETAVTERTTDIVIEAAAFAPAAVRESSRRHGIHSDSCHRFERGVHPGQVADAAERLAELILQLCGGTLCGGVLAEGGPVEPPRELTLRPDQCRRILGLQLADVEMLAALEPLGFQPRLQGGTIHCVAPIQRLDVRREIDLVEEIARVHGLDRIGQSETIPVRVAQPDRRDQARRAVNQTLAGLGFVETVTHTLISEAHAAAFTAPGLTPLRVADERARSEPVLRPSILPSLLRVLAHNHDNGVRDVKLQESASTFALQGSAHLEVVNTAMIAPAASVDQGARDLRGVIDRLATLLAGPAATVSVESVNLPWLTPGATVRINDEAAGAFGILSPAVLSMFGLSGHVVAAELSLSPWFDNYPPETEARPLPAFPAIERDVSAIVAEHVTWDQLSGTIDLRALKHAEAAEFVTTYRGKQIGQGRKSVTLRLRFRALDRTLKHDEVDAQMQAVMDGLRTRLGAEIRA